MFKQWMMKLKEFLNRDEKEQRYEGREDYPRQRQELKTRMTYKYPNSRNFKFPVIPDESEKQGPTNRVYRQEERKPQEPAYKRRDREVTPLRTKNNDTHNRKVYKSEDAPPFELTEVPSPIYGFQKRNENVDEVPAYQRKQENKKVENNDLHTVIDSIGEKNRDNKKIQDEVSVSSYQDEKHESVIESHSANLSSFNRQQVQSSGGSKRDENKTIQQIAKEQTGEDKRKQKKKSKHRRKTQNRNKQEEAVPYNVMMSPIDQLKYQQQKSNRNKKEENIEQFKREQPKEETNIQNNANDMNYHMPMYLLNDPEPHSNESDIWIEEQKTLLKDTLSHFHVNAHVVKATQGPSVTRFEVQPEMGVKVSKIKNLSDDLKLNMAAEDIRIEAPIPGKNTVGIEVPNPEAQMVGLQEMFETEKFKDSDSPLSIALGLTIEGQSKITNIQKMPHGLIAGATGSGKSVCINSILISMLYKASYEDVKFLLIDPKMVELAPYNGIPHLVSPVITDVKAATQSLKWAVSEMEERYERFVEAGVRDIHRYNDKVIAEGRKEEKMPYIVIVIDELADLMMMSPQDVETSISRIAQKARACGIHLLLATQRPSVDVITGLIKANIPTRIAFSVSSQVDSRTILDTSGAEKLLGKGDMLFIENGTGKSARLQGPFVSDEEIERVTAHARQIAEPNYLFEQDQLLEQVQTEEDEDELLEDAIEFVLRQQGASTSMLQRHFKIGYNRAARLIDTMEMNGIISGQNGSKPREVLITEAATEQW